MSRRQITAGFWWQTVANSFATLTEFLTRAQKAERDEKGHECGHRFEVSVRSSLHISGPGEHTDADYYDACRPVEVRAHNLRDALLLAAALPLGEWFEPDDPEPLVVDGDAAYLTPSATPLTDRLREKGVDRA